MFDNIYSGKRVFITGVQGFCGSWLALWLRHLGANVIGYGRPARTRPNHFDAMQMMGEPEVGITITADLLTVSTLTRAILDTEPDLIIHLAAKAIVAKTFDEPQETFENNVMGAVNILEASRLCETTKGVVFITTDKVYRDRNWRWGYRESDILDAVDPYSASKVCAEQVIKCYRECYGVNIAVARAGNVIGGGDWSYKRLIPDVVRATSQGGVTVIHTPEATRPWQHVLEALNGYLLLGEALLKGDDVNGAFNFGPQGKMTVREVLRLAAKVWPSIEWRVDGKPTHPHMVYLLSLDNTKAQDTLGWSPVWDMETTVEKTIRWYRDFYTNGYHEESLKDIIEFEKAAGRRL